MVGDGPAKRHWLRLTRSLDIEKHVDWTPWQPHDTLDRIYASHNVLLFPALHDSGGLAALEAMHHGLPVVCLKLGGPATLVDDKCGRLIEAGNKNAAQVALELGKALIDLREPSIRRPLAEAARRRGMMFGWDEKVKRVYGAHRLLHPNFVEGYAPGE
jgi:glycosyltransferase involved in cell wall biosynthesis